MAATLPTLYYLPVRARGEALRMLLRYSSQAFRDEVVPFADWVATEKSRMPKNDDGRQTLPVFEDAGGMLPESAKIAAKIARHAGAPLWPDDTAAREAAGKMWGYNDSPCAPWCSEGVQRLGM